MSTLALFACFEDVAPSTRVADGAVQSDTGDASRGDAALGAPISLDAGALAHAALDGAASMQAAVDSAAPAQAAVDGSAPALPPFALCDGSADLRLTIRAEPGELSSPAWYFSHPYGTMFLFVNGRCEYVVSYAGLRTWRQGTLTTARAEALAASLHLAELSNWVTPDQDRWLAGRWTIQAGTAQYTCGDCAGEGPAAASEALARVPALLTELEENAAPLTGPLQVAIIEDGALTGTEVPWALAWSPGEIAVANDASVAEALTSATRTLTGDEATTLRALRDQRFEPHNHGAGLRVLHQGRGYFVTMRDVLSPSFQVTR